MKSKSKPDNKKEVLPGMKADKGTYSVEIKYSQEAIDKKLIKLVPKDNQPIEISVDELVELMTNYVNSEVLAPVFVDSQRINMVYVKRQIESVANRDILKGERIRLEYEHPYPLEFALLEEAYKIALISREKLVLTLTEEFLKSVKDKIKPISENFIKKFYRQFKNLDLGGSS